MGGTHSSEPRIAPVDVVLVPPPQETFKPWHHAFPAIIPATTTKLHYERVNGENKVFDHATGTPLFQVLKHTQDIRVIDATTKALVATLRKTSGTFAVIPPESSPPEHMTAFAIRAMLLVSDVHMHSTLSDPAPVAGFGPAATLKFEMSGNWDMDKAMVVWQTRRHSETQRKSQRREPICKIQVADKGYDIDFVPGVDATLMAIFCIVLNEKPLR
jgi:hypothetical protein